MAAAGDRFVLASGRAALADALGPTGRLGDASAFRAAAAKLGSGGRPSFIADAQKLGGLAGSKPGGHGTSATCSSASARSPQ